MTIDLMPTLDHDSVRAADKPAAGGLSAPPRADRDEALDGIRAIACLLVYSYHMGSNLSTPPLVVHGITGVHIFFVLSGYLMFGPFAAGLIGARPMPELRRYAIRRFTRIYPPYLVSLALFTAARYLRDLKPPSAANLAEHALLIFNYGPRHHFFSINGVFWSLAIEAQFYVLLPLVAWLAAQLVGRRGPSAAILVVGGFLAIGLTARGFEHALTAGARMGEPRFRSVFAYLDLFAYGMAVDLARRVASARLGRSAFGRWALIAAGAALFLGANHWAYAQPGLDWQTSADPIFTIGYPPMLCGGVALALLAVVCWPDDGPSLLTWRPLVRVGLISYSFYLYHMGVLFAIGTALPRSFLPTSEAGQWLSTLLILPPTLALSALMYMLVECPSLRWGARFSQHHARPPLSS